MLTYCLNNPVMYSDPTGLCAKAWAAGYQGPCPGQGKPGCMDNWSQFQDTPAIIAPVKPSIDSNVPPDHPEYKPPKKGGDKKVKNPNGEGNGWPAKDGGVWVPTPGMHGGDGWTVQYPDGSHWHGYPGGGVRKAQKQSNPIAGGAIVIFGLVATGYLVLNDITGLGAADDMLISGSVGCIIGGVDMIGGHYNCDCGESWYGFR